MVGCAAHAVVSISCLLLLLSTLYYYYYYCHIWVTRARVCVCEEIIYVTQLPAGWGRGIPGENVIRTRPTGCRYVTRRRLSACLVPRPPWTARHRAVRVPTPRMWRRELYYSGRPGKARTNFFAVGGGGVRTLRHGKSIAAAIFPRRQQPLLCTHPPRPVGRVFVVPYARRTRAPRVNRSFPLHRNEYYAGTILQP